MARIALIAGMAVLGAAISVATGGLGTFAVGAWMADIIAGASVGAMVGSVLSALIFPPKGAMGPQLNDRQVQSSAPGMPIPWGYGSYRIAGCVIWASQINEATQKQSQGGKGGGPTSTSYIYSADIAISFGYGPGKITRIWADSKLVYDVTSKTPIAIDTGWTHSNGQQITSPFEPVIYTGTATQQPDPTIQAALGASATPAFRDQIYFVAKGFPLADYGNRVPNFRAEVSIGGTLSFVKDLYPPNGLPDPYWPSGPNQIYPPLGALVDPLNRAGYVFNQVGGVVQKIDLNTSTGTPLDPWAPNTVYQIGAQVLDDNGNVEYCYGSASSHESGSSAPTWVTGEGGQTADHDLHWQNMGPGPDSVSVVADKVLSISGGFQAFASTYTVDTAGYIWIQGFTGGGSKATMYKIDPQTFSVAGQLKLAQNGSDPSYLGFGRAFDGLTPMKSSATGKNYLYAICDSGVDTMSPFSSAAPAHRIFCVIDADACTIVSHGSFAASGAGAPVLAQRLPIVDPSTGDAYVLVYNTTGGGSHATTSVLKVQAQSGAVVVSAARAIADTDFSPAGTPAYMVAGYWVAQDKTLLLQTNNTGGINSASLIKFDFNSGTILETLNGLAQDNGGGAANDVLQQAYNGLAPSDGTIKLITMVSGEIAFMYVNVSTLAVEQTVPVGNWLSSGAGGALPLSMGYDALSDSMLMCFQTGPYSNMSVRIFFDREAVGASLLTDVLADVWAKSGADPSLLDAHLMAGVQVRGYPVTSTSNGKGIIQPLCMAYFFDMVESDNVLVAVPRGQSVSTVIPESDLGILGDQFKMQPTVMQENDLPKSITVAYYDQTLDYQQGKQMFQRNARVKKTKNQTTMQLPLTLQPDEAAHIAWKALATAWQERNQWEFKLWRPSYLVLDPTDVVQFTYNGQQYTSRICKHQVGQNLVLQVTAVSENAAQYSPSNSGAGIDGFVTGTIQPVGPTLLLAMDIPFVQDIDAVASGFEGYYWAVGSPTGGKWPGAQLYVSPDNQAWLGQAADTSGATYGVVVDPTPAPRTLYAWDYINTLNVRIVEGTLASTTSLNVLNGANWFYLGGEIMAFQNATLNADGSYTLDTLLRGMRGTEGWTGTHVTGETFVLLDNSIQHQIVSSSQIGLLQYIRGVTIGQPVAASTSQQLQLQGNDLKPYAPAQLTGSIDGSSNILISWARRTRIGGAWLDGTGTVPLSEETESYDLSVYSSDGSVLKRSVTGLTSPSFTYTAAMQTTDFGSTQPFVFVVVWQNSAVVGHGFPATNPTCGLGNVVSGGSDATSILGVTITGSPADGDILQYNSGANAWQIVGPLFKRQTVSKTTGSLAGGAAETGTWSSVACKSLIILEAFASTIARVQLYSTAAARDADNGRAFGIMPEAGVQNGIIADFNLSSGDPSTGIAALVCSSPLIGSNMDSSPADQIYYRITNISGSTHTITASITIVPVEV